MEIWKDILGYEGYYQISNRGNIKSLNRKGNKNEKILKACANSGGYLQVELFKNNKGKKCYVHRLVAEHFVENPDNNTVINHKDENPKNNSFENLEWCNYKYNSNYGNNKLKRRRTRFRNKNPNVTVYYLTQEQIRELGY